MRSVKAWRGFFVFVFVFFVFLFFFFLTIGKKVLSLSVCDLMRTS